MEEKEFEIKDIDELFMLIQKGNFAFLKQDSNNLAFIYKDNKGRIIFLPPVGDKGVVFENETAYLNSSNDPKNFPLKEEKPSPFQVDQDRITDLNGNIDFYLSVLGQELDITIDVSNSDQIYLESIDTKIKRYGYLKAYDKLFLPLGIYIGEIIKKRKKGVAWKLTKKFGYMPYFEPSLVDNSREYFPWYKLFDFLIVRRSFRISEYYQIVSKGLPIEKSKN